MAVALRFAAVARDSPAAAAPPRVGKEQQYLACAAAARPGGRCSRRRGLVVRCQSGAAAVVLNKDDAASVAAAAASSATGFTVAMKFGGSSVASAERMREVADLILSFPEETPVVVLSAMGKTTNNLLLVTISSSRCDCETEMYGFFYRHSVLNCEWLIGCSGRREGCQLRRPEGV